MKLKSRFSLIALLCGIEMAFLTGLSMIGANYIQKIQNFQFNQQECQFALADMINYLNQSIHWSTDVATINDVWKEKIISANNKFRALSENPMRKFFPEEFIEQIDKSQTVWLKVVSQTNPFGAQFQSIQQTSLTDDEAGYIKRYGIKAGATRFPDSENVKSLQSRIILMEQQMKDIIKNGSDLQDVMAKTYIELVEIVENFTRMYRFIVIILGLIFIGLVFLSILQGTNRVIHGIKKVRDMSLDPPQRHFTSEIDP